MNNWFYPLSLFLVFILITLIGYSMWFEKLSVNVYVDTASSDTKIGSYKAQVCCIHSHCNCCCCSCHGLEDYQMSLSSDGKTLYLRDIDSSCCSCHDGLSNVTIWIGLIIENNGELPVRIDHFNITIHGNYSMETINTYLHGPYKTGIGYHEWGHVDGCDLPYPNYVSSIILDQGEKLIAWIEVNLYNASGYLDINVTLDNTLWNIPG